MESYLKLQAVATLAAKRAGEHVLTNLHRRGDVNSIMRSDVKHKLDVEAEEIAKGVVLAAFPDHAILAEEGGAALSGSDYLWIIDPIDGTINFFHGLPLWCCSIAVRYRGETCAAAVYLPELEELYEATKDGPALCNGRVLNVTTTDKLEYSMLATGADRWDLGEHSFKFMRKIAEIAQRPRILGAAAIDICYVAAGKIDGYFEAGIYLWDMAAAALIVERAGGRCSILKEYGNHRMAVVASNAQLYEPLCAALRPLLS